jgi:hypothetical protein
MGRQPQPQAPPQHPPAGVGVGALPPRATATVDRSLTVSACPAGQVAGCDDWSIGRDTSKVSPQVRQRKS